MDEVRYRPGDWLAVVGATTTVVLPPDQGRRAARVWRAVDDGDGFGAVLDAVLREGIEDLAAFAVLARDGRGVRAIVRGGLRVLLGCPGGEQVLTGAPDATWLERRVPEVGAVVVETDDVPAAAGGDLGVRTGLVRASRVELGASAPASASPVARLSFSSGDVVDVDAPVLVGRAPEPRRFDPDQQPRLVGVPSPGHEISGTHLEVRPGTGEDAGSATATDLGSTNGTVLVRPGLPAVSLSPGIATVLTPGSVLDLGDGATIRVEPV